MTQKRKIWCCCCGKPIHMTPLATIYGPVDLHEGLCRQCLALVGADRRALLRQARRELCRNPAEYRLFMQSWHAVRSQSIERRAGRQARWRHFVGRVRSDILGIGAA